MLKYTAGGNRTNPQKKVRIVAHALLGVNFVALTSLSSPQSGVHYMDNTYMYVTPAARDLVRPLEVSLLEVTLQDSIIS